MGVGQSLHPPLNPLPSREGMVLGSPLPEGEGLGEGVDKPHPLRRAQGASSGASCRNQLAGMCTATFFRTTRKPRRQRKEPRGKPRGSFVLTRQLAA
jgi:hypothetical protein